MAKYNYADIKESLYQIKKMGRFRYGVSHGIAFSIIVYTASQLVRLKDESFSQIFLTVNSIWTFLLTMGIGVAGYCTLFWWINELTLKRINKLK